MQITLKLKYRSKCYAAAEQQPSKATIRGSDSFSIPRVPFFTGACAPASCVDEKREIVSGVKPLNHFFDLRKKRPAPVSEASLASFEAPSKSLEATLQLDQILREEVQVQPSSRIFMHTEPRGAAADRFRFLRMYLRELWSAGKVKTLQVTSPLPQDGKSTVAMNLATALAEGGKRTVLLIEADLHRPTLNEQLGLERRAGLADCLEGNLNPMSLIRRLEPLGWFLLPAGEPHSNPTELLQGEALAGMLQTLSAHFDWILFDSPPVMPLTDALSIARQADATLLVAREGRTPRETIEKSIAILGRQRVLGIVLNAVEGLNKIYSGHYGYGGYPGNNALMQVGRAEIRKDSAVQTGRNKQSVLDLPK